MRRGRHEGRSPFAVGAIVLALIAVGSYFGFTKSNPFASPYELRAAFRTANDLKKNALVRVAGVTVGKVTSVEPVKGSATGALVTMEIDDEGLPIHRDAELKVRPRIFMEGNFFVDLRPGSPSAPLLREGELIPVQQTSAPVQFGQLLTALQSDTREDLKTVLDEYGRGVSGDGGRGYNRSIPYWKPAYRSSAIVNEAMLGLLERDLSGYVRGAGAVAEALDRNASQLKSLITDFAATADAFADEERNLSAAIHELPNTLRTGKRAFAQLNASFPSVRRFIADLRPAVRSSDPALTAGIPFATQARRLVSRAELGGLVSDLRPVVPSLVELNEGGVGLQRQLRLLSSCQNEVVLPWSRTTLQDANFPATGPVYQEGVKWLPGIAGESRSFDANGQYIRTLAQTANYAYPLGDGRFFFTTEAIQGVNPPKADGPPPLRPEIPCETQQGPDLRSTPAPPPAARRVDWNAPGTQARYEEAKARAVSWLRDDVARIGLDDRLRVVTRDLTAAEIPQLTKARPGGAR